MRRHAVFATIYPWIDRQADLAGAGRHRAELLAGLRGRVVEVGAGHGPNFRHYPREVTEVVAVEPDVGPRARAIDAAGRSPTPVAGR